jgi:hypothetical protein
MSKEYRDEVTTRGGHEVEVRVTENHPSYRLHVDSSSGDCHWSENFTIDPTKRAPGDTELLAYALMRLGRRWALLYCP